MQKLKNDLNSLDAHFEGAEVLVCRMPSSGLEFEICERTESLFLSYTVACEFKLPLPNLAAPSNNVRISIHTTGLIRLRGIHCKAHGNDGEVTKFALSLQNNPAVEAALKMLDFRSAELHGDANGWKLCIEHIGASEVVSRFPAMRRYIRLTPEQRTRLLACWLTFLKL